MKIENSSPDSQPLPPFCGPQIVHFEVFFLGKILLSEEKSIVQVLFFCIIYLLRSVHVTLSMLWWPISCIFKKNLQRIVCKLKFSRLGHVWTISIVLIWTPTYSSDFMHLQKLCVGLTKIDLLIFLVTELFKA